MLKKFKCCLEKLCSQENRYSKYKEEYYEVGFGVLATLFMVEDELTVYFSGLRQSAQIKLCVLSYNTGAWSENMFAFFKEYPYLQWQFFW